MTGSGNPQATAAQVKAVRLAAEQFCERQGIDTTGTASAFDAINAELDPGPGATFQTKARALRLRILWHAALRRLTGSVDGTGRKGR
jgi:hypothetical protein